MSTRVIITYKNQGTIAAVPVITPKPRAGKEATP